MLLRSVKKILAGAARTRFGRYDNPIKQRRNVTALAGTAVLLSICVAAAPSAVAQDVPHSSSSYKRTLQDYADQLQDAGVIGTLIHTQHGRDSVKVRSGKARLGTSKPVPWNAHFKTGSTTKTFVATVILQLEAEHKLSLDDSLHKWLPDILGPNYNESNITLRHLLNHTSGIFDYTRDDAFLPTFLTKDGFESNRFRHYSVNEMLDKARSHQPVFEPGASWRYSTTNYLLAGQIIKAVTGNDWEKEVRSRIIAPLNLTATTAPGSQAGLPHPHAQGYNIFSTDPANRTYTDTTLHNMSWANAAGELITTTSDENRFFRALMQGRLLSPEQLAKMKTVVMLDEKVGYGLGIVWSSLPCDSRGYWSHSGGAFGYTTLNGVSDDGQRSAVISMSTSSFTDETFMLEREKIGTDALGFILCDGKGEGAGHIHPLQPSNNYNGLTPNLPKTYPL